jgi:hypothetical protein
LWNEQCTVAVARRKSAFATLKNDYSFENYVNYCKVNAETKRTSRSTKRNSWKQFCTRTTPLSDVWKKSKAFKKGNYNSCTSITEDQLSLFSNSVAFAYVADNRELASSAVYLSTPSEHFLDVPFTEYELQAILEKKIENLFMCVNNVQ